MILSDLPKEIIEQFAKFLSLEAKISCSLVCKSWKKLFQDSINSDILVHRSFLNNLVNHHQDNQPPCLKTRLLVRYLEIGYHTLTTDEELYVLQQTFPNIKYLHLGTYSIIPDNFGVTADWNIWRSLTELHISIDQKHVPDIENTLVKLLLCLPLLRRLQILSDQKMYIQLSFSLDNFETIHSQLNHLEYMELKSNLLMLSETDIERITDVSPATNMRSMNIFSENTDHRWLCYFARKYPNLHTLKFTASNIQPETYEKRKDTIALFQKVPLPFQHLTKLNFVYAELYGNENILFWDIMNFPNMPLKHFSVKIYLQSNVVPSIALCDISKHVTEVCLPEFAKTIESFCLMYPVRYLTRSSPADIKCTLDNLVELYMDTFMPCEMDVLLYTAPRLRAIEMRHSNIKLKGELYNSSRSGLQKFKVWKSDITSDVLRFLSFHCRSLNELDLQDISVYGNFTTPGCQFIDMTYTRLDKFYLERTDFILQEGERSEGHAVLITRPIDDIPPKQDCNHNVLPAVHDPPVQFYYQLFYTCDEVWNISSDEYSYSKNFPYREENKITTKCITEYVDTKEEEDESSKYNRFSNYTKIELGYVSEFTICYTQ